MPLFAFLLFFSQILKSETVDSEGIESTDDPLSLGTYDATVRRPKSHGRAPCPGQALALSRQPVCQASSVRTRLHGCWLKALCTPAGYVGVWAGPCQPSTSVEYGRGRPRGQPGSLSNSALLARPGCPTEEPADAGRAKHRCADCTAAFTTTEALTKHLLVHTACCGICNKSFAGSQFLRRHMEERHGYVRIVNRDRESLGDIQVMSFTFFSFFCDLHFGTDMCSHLLLKRWQS